jgi:hypothetical protein
MVVPSGLADSLNVPSIMGALGASGLIPRGDAVETASRLGPETSAGSKAKPGATAASNGP